MRKTVWPAVYAVTALVLFGILAALLLVVPRTEGGAIDWLAPMIKNGWMAWTLPIALFFYTIASLIVVFTIVAVRFPETPRIGVFRTETTRGDRLFISLLGSAFIHLAWLFFLGPSHLWGASIVCAAYVLAVFRWV